MGLPFFLFFFSLSTNKKTIKFTQSLQFTLVLSFLKKIEDKRKYFFKKYVHTINHKRIALNYLYFTVISALSGASLATMIRGELAYPGSHFFKGDSLRYLQVITAHGLTMVFYVVIPLVFGFLANFLILPAGFLLISKPAFLRASFFKYFDKPSFYMNVIDFNLFDNFFYFYNGKSFYDLNTSNSVLTTKQ